jgi:hypothetical protein
VYNLKNNERQANNADYHAHGRNETLEEKEEEGKKKSLAMGKLN